MIIEEAEAVSIRPAAEYLRVLIPRNLFRALVVEGRMLLPVVLLALLVGFNLDFDRSYAPVLQNITDALSRLFYRINALVTEVIAIGLIALAASLVFDMRSVQELELFQQLFIVLSFTTVFIVLVIFPLALYFVGRVKNPAYWLYGMIAPAITAVFSTDSYFALGTLTRVGKDNFGIPRNVGSPAFSLVTVFGRSGSAMVIASSFLLLLRSYSSLEITVGQALWVLLFTFLVSFTLGSFPGSAVTTGLAALCALYGQGMEEAFLILRPAAAVLLSLGTFVDVMTAGLVGFLVSERRGMRKNIYPEDFV
jgi:Na+/H+-dicarboxylate symporter